jgi:hypothetical protein
MKTKKATLNKDGSARKSGSGRKKGSNSFVKVSFSQLKEYIGERAPMLVSRVCLESLGFIVYGNETSVTIQAQSTEEKQEIAFSFNNFDEE